MARSNSRTDEAGKAFTYPAIQPVAPSSTASTRVSSQPQMTSSRGACSRICATRRESWENSLTARTCSISASRASSGGVRSVRVENGLL